MIKAIIEQNLTEDKFSVYNTVYDLKTLSDYYSKIPKTSTTKFVKFMKFSQGQTAIVPDSQINVSEKKGKMFKFDTGATLDDLVRAVNQVGLAPGDLMSVLEALDKAGAIDGKLEII